MSYYEGSRRVRRKFVNLAKARREANLVAIKLANGEVEVLKLVGTDRADYVHAMRHLREWNKDAHLNLAVVDYVAAKKRLPDDVSLKEVVDSYLKRHPIGLPQKIVQEVVDELVESKEKAGKSEVYTRKMSQYLGHLPKPSVCASHWSVGNKSKTTFAGLRCLDGRKTTSANWSTRCFGLRSNVDTQKQQEQLKVDAALATTKKKAKLGPPPNSPSPKKSKAHPQSSWPLIVPGGKIETNRRKF